MVDVLLEGLLTDTADQSPRLATGLTELDRVIGGMRVGGKTIIGAKPGMGKSLLLKQFTLNLSRRGIPVGVISVEESRQKIAENVLANVSGVVNNRIAFGKLNGEEKGRVGQAGEAIHRLPIFVIDSARKLTSIVAAAHALRHRHDVQVIAVDHLHIVDGETNEHREREIAKISAELKWVWKDLGVAGLEAAQLNRGSGRDRPSLASLRDSGSLEQDADIVLLLHREDYYRGPTEAKDDHLEIIVAKNKDGATGVVPAHYDGARQSVSDYQGHDPLA